MKDIRAHWIGWIAVMALALTPIHPALAQNDSTTYTVDPSFDSSELFFSGSSGIGTIALFDDGRILVGGGFETSGPGGFTLFAGLGMVWGDGSEYTDWGGGGLFAVPQVTKYQDGFLASSITGIWKYTDNGDPFYFWNGIAWCEYFWSPGIDNPYNVESMWCMYVQDDDKVLIGGAVATDTTQPNLFRNLVRVWPDGSNDTGFPAIEIAPNNPNTAVYGIDRDHEGRWLISGDFTAINGHETAHIARLNQDFSVDTGFVSPLDYIISGPTAQVVLVDSQDRIWLSGNRMIAHDNPEDTINVLRIFPTGEVDTTFLPRRVDDVYPSSNSGLRKPYVKNGIELEGSNAYMLYGRFNYFNDTLQPCITVVDDVGNIQYNYFQSDGATELIYGSSMSPDSAVPYVGAVEELPDGSLIVGGGFSKFMGTEHYNLIKLNRGTIGTADRGPGRPLTVYPNPASGRVEVSLPGTQVAEVTVYDLSGRQTYRGVMRNGHFRIPVGSFAPGMYILRVQSERGSATGKFVVENR